jgi:hypothetical protein
MNRKQLKSIIAYAVLVGIFGWFCVGCEHKQSSTEEENTIEAAAELMSKLSFEDYEFGDRFRTVDSGSYVLLTPSFDSKAGHLCTKYYSLWYFFKEKAVVVSEITDQVKRPLILPENGILGTPDIQPIADGGAYIHTQGNYWYCYRDKATKVSATTKLAENASFALPEKQP